MPSWREVDFEPRGDRLPAREAWRQDLFEEIWRQAGLDAIPATLPALGGVDSGENPEHDRRDRLRDRLAGFGYAEAIHYAFGERRADSAFPRLVGEGEPIALANPLSELYAVMRRSLVPNLVAAAEFNANRGARAVRLFESGHLFPGGDAGEIEALAMVTGGNDGGPWDRRAESDLLGLKGEIEALLADLGVEAEVAPAELPGVTPGTGATLSLGGENVGWFGRLRAFDGAFPLFAAELVLDRLPLHSDRIRVEPPSRFPGIDADFTLTHVLDLAWRELAAAIRDARVEDLAGFDLKDRYQGKGIPAGAVATTIAFHYNAPERSLTQEEVNQRHQALAGDLERRFGSTDGPQRRRSDDSRLHGRPRSAGERSRRADRRAAEREPASGAGARPESAARLFSSAPAAARGRPRGEGREARPGREGLDEGARRDPPPPRSAHRPPRSPAALVSPRGHRTLGR